MIVRSCSVAPKNSGIRRLLKEMIHRNKGEIPRKNGKRFILRRSRKLRKLGQASPSFGRVLPSLGRLIPTKGKPCPNFGHVASVFGRLCQKRGRSRPNFVRGMPNVGPGCPVFGIPVPKIANAAQSLGRFPSLKRRGGCASNKKSRSHRRAAQTGWSVRRSVL